MEKHRENILFIEAFSGLAGDMFLSALAELADSFDLLKKLPEKLNLTDAEVHIEDVNKNGIACKQVKVYDRNKQNSGRQKNRLLKDIISIIDNASINNKAKIIAKDIFNIIGQAESKIHKVPLENIHFHEISGVDSIIDIVGCAILIERLNIVKSYATPVCTGFGFVKTQHGLLPVPAPATLEILKEIPFYRGDEEGEKLTPTGAAILNYLNPVFRFKELKILKTAYGPGEKNFSTPNALRLSLIDLKTDPDELLILETHLDDIKGEHLGANFQQKLLEHKGIDFYFTNIQMKKARPGLLLSCLVKRKHLKDLSDFILENTTSIGIRYYPVERITLQREVKRVETPYGNVKIKMVSTPNGKKRFKIEHDELIRLSAKHDLSVPQIENEIIAFLNNKTDV